ncbi:ArnT family glycosyltransferase [Maioricimonas rarisocia]|uniref:ArnT family glycosyltransferase n=1 Tax=Maioricimonas rarisocia TaxID=2528026 RepID=UPI0018D21259|nr:phospholipid carrier-dependent glycosyltransferase [Maioricimonas rarisocia]
MATRSRKKSTPATMEKDDDVPRGAEQRLLRIALVTFLAALLLRSLYPFAMAVEHFDEGVYASNLYAWHLDNRYPDRHLYAPPLLPALLEWAMIFTGGTAHAAMWVNVLAGSLTAALVAWISGRWFGTAAAVTAGVLAVTSEVHMLYSRAALTDALLCLWMLAGVYAGWKAILSGRPVWIAAAGLLASLAWWTKYNGWLTLAVTGAGTAAWLVVDRIRNSVAGTAALRWLATAVAAVLLWLPLLNDLQQTGGYGPVAANHAKYVVGFSGWLDSFRQQLANHSVLNGWLTIAGLTAIAVFAIVKHRPATAASEPAETSDESLPVPRRRIRVDALIGGLGLAIVAAFVGSTASLGVITLVTLVLIPLKVDRQAQAARAADADLLAAWRAQRLAIWMVAAWFFGLLLATPLYHPYPRLTLPWLVAAWLGAGVTVGRIANGRRATGSEPDQETNANARRWFPNGATAVLTAGIAAVVAWGLGASRETTAPAGVVAWEDRTSFQILARNLLDDIETAVAALPKSTVPEYDAVVYVYAEPALYFHLASLEGTSWLQFITQPAGNLDMVRPEASTDRRLPTFVITGPHGHRTPEEIDAALPFLAPVSRHPYTPSTLVLLNDLAPPLPDRKALPAEYEVQLLRLNFGN